GEASGDAGSRGSGYTGSALRAVDPGLRGAQSGHAMFRGSFAHALYARARPLQDTQVPALRRRSAQRRFGEGPASEAAGRGLIWIASSGMKLPFKQVQVPPRGTTR